MAAGSKGRDGEGVGVTGGSRHYITSHRWDVVLLSRSPRPGFEGVGLCKLFKYLKLSRTQPAFRTILHMFHIFVKTKLCLPACLVGQADISNNHFASKMVHLV